MIGTIIGLSITLILLGIIFFGFWCAEDDIRIEKYNSSFNAVKINDRFQSKTTNDPFSISDKQIAVIISKESSPVDKKKYVLFVYNNVKYSAEWKEFNKYFVKVYSNSKASKIDIDTNINGDYKKFREEYTNKDFDEEIGIWVN